jgi:3-oxoacyl-[acyl-carrier-protein] synthase II
MVFSSACTASTVAIAYAIELLRSGRVDVVLTGGMDPLAELSFVGFCSMSNVSSAPCAPFSEPVGLTLGEGAAMFILEAEPRAIGRGAAVRARMLGYGLTADAYHPTSGDPSGRPQARAAANAIAMAGLQPSDIGYVNAHGTGTIGNDPVETRAFRQLFGKQADVIPVSSIKGAIGHTLGAAGAIEAAMTSLAVERQYAPPTANFVGARKGCDLDYIPGRARSIEKRYALSLNFAFGGNNAALVIGAASGAPPQPTVPLQRRVVITGLGIVSPIGCGVGAFQAALASDRTGIQPICRFATEGLGTRLGGTIDDAALSRLTRADLRRTDRIGALTVCAAELAIADARLAVKADNQDRVGIVIGTGHGPLESCRRFFSPIAERLNRRPNPALFPNTVMNAGAGLAAAQLRVKGPNMLVSSGQASGLAALCIAYDLVRSGIADAVIAGGVEELERSLLEGYAATRRVAPHDGPRAIEESAPFDLRRSGMVLGEGGGLLMLEALDSALARNARIYGEVGGWAGNADLPRVRGWDETGEGVAACMTRALEDAAVEPSQIDLVAAAGLSHPLHDLAEARAIDSVFADRAVPVTALSSRIGMSAATSPLSAAAVALGICEGFLPAGARRSEPDPECRIELIEGANRNARPDLALVNAATLGGSNFSLVLKRWQQ